MSNNREIISFPFRPHLALYLYTHITNQEIESLQHFHKPLDIDLRSPHGKIIRLLLERVDYPQVKKVKKGFRFWVSIPKKAGNHPRLMVDGQRAGLAMPLQAVELINDLYEMIFRDHYLTFVHGYVHGNQGNRFSVRQATEIFIEKYDLELAHYTYDMLVKHYKRSHSPLKKSIYAKKNSETTTVNFTKPYKNLIMRLSKK